MTSQNSRNAFIERTTARKGAIGEQIVDLLLLQKNIIPYGALVNNAHPFDRMCASADKRNIFIVEVKTKARRTYYPDTGVDIRHYMGYRHVKATYNIPVYLIFVDEMLGKVYGGELAHLESPLSIAHRGKMLNYPLKQRGIIYFPLAHMKDISELTKETMEDLRALSSRRYEYVIRDGTADGAYTNAQYRLGDAS
jgi:hypothetical protein